MRLKSIASGSSGNCIYVGNADTHVLVDAGISAKRIAEGLSTLDITPSDIDAVFITHEHSDHISGLSVLSRKFRLPIYATAGTIDAILNGPKQDYDPALFNEISPDDTFCLNDLLIDPIRVSHDAADPVCYRFYADAPESERVSVAVCTDLGIYDDYIVDRLKGVSALLLEANHDIRMLEAGSYPYFLKRRISGDKGHLSNDSAGMLLCALMGDDRLKTVLLGHLSQENNYPALAFETVRMQLKMTGYECDGSESPRGSAVSLGIAPRDVPGKLISCF